MPNQTIPITLSWGAFSGTWSANDINQLGTLIAQQLSASLRADISFVPIVTTDPVGFSSQLIFNVAQNVFKSWDVVTGSYRPVTDSIVGDIGNTLVGNDNLAVGRVILNGRKIADIPGLSSRQLANLQSLFGSGADQTIPSVSPANVSGLPVGNAFGSIPWSPNLNPTYLPAAGVIAPGLTFSNPVTDTEAQALANATEQLRSSGNDAFTVTKDIQALCQQVLNALNTNTNPPIYAFVFCGFP